MDKQQKRLGEILIEKKLISEKDLNKALKEQKKTKEFLGAVLIRNKIIKEKDLLQALSEHFGMEQESLKDKYIDWELVRHFTSSLILDHHCFPLRQDGDFIVMAIVDPLNAWAQEKAESETKELKPKFVLVTQEDMQEVEQRYTQNLRLNIAKMFE